MSFRNGPHSCIWVWVASVETMEKVSVFGGGAFGAQAARARTARTGIRRAVRIMRPSIAQLSRQASEGGDFTPPGVIPVSRYAKTGTHEHEGFRTGASGRAAISLLDM